MTNLRNFLRVEKSGDEFEFTFPNNRYLLVTVDMDTEEERVVGGEWDEVWQETHVTNIEIESVELLHEVGSTKIILLEKDKDQLIEPIVELIESGNRFFEDKRTA